MFSINLKASRKGCLQAAPGSPGNITVAGHYKEALCSQSRENIHNECLRRIHQSATARWCVMRRPRVGPWRSQRDLPSPAPTSLLSISGVWPVQVASPWARPMEPGRRWVSRGRGALLWLLLLFRQHLLESWSPQTSCLVAPCGSNFHPEKFLWYNLCFETQDGCYPPDSATYYCGALNKLVYPGVTQSSHLGNG